MTGRMEPRIMNHKQEGQAGAYWKHQSSEACHCPENVMRNSTIIGKRLIGIGILLCLTSIGVVAPGVMSLAQDANPVLIAHVTVPERPFSKTEVQNIFLGKVTKIEGTKVLFVILKSGDVHADFLKTYLSRTQAQYKKYWKKLIFSGKGKSPKAFKTEAELLEYIAQTPGSLGYVGASTAESLTYEDIRPVTVQ